MPRATKDTKPTKATKTAKPAAKPAAKGAKTGSAVKSTKAAKPTKAVTSAKPAKAAATAKSAKPVKPAKPVTTAKDSKTPKAAAKPVKKVSGVEFSNFEPYTPRRGEKYMNEKQLAHFKSILLNWKSELMQEVDRTVTHMKDEAANFPDPADRATQEEEFSLELRTRDRERKLIKKIDSTMELIEQDDYGYCEACGIEIGIQRLEARPTATQCIDCKTLAEIKEKQEMG